MKKKEIKNTQHYTVYKDQIFGNLLHYIPKEAALIEPFAGAGTLLELFPGRNWETYDIAPAAEDIIERDTLSSPPDYAGKWVITNPPYLAKNKAANKEIFLKYPSLDDLYKISLKTIIGAEGGLIVIPLNFFTDERSKNIRKLFLDFYDIVETNIFTRPIFPSTTYSVCSFFFKKREIPKESQSQKIKINLYFEKEDAYLTLKSDFDYRLGGQFYSDLQSVKPIFGRLTKDGNNKKFTTNIKLYALDTRDEKIRLEYDEDHFYGKQTDRIYATLTSDIEITIEDQKRIIEEFNVKLNSFREHYYNMVLTNYRDYNRKRVGFDFSYRLATFVFNELP